MTFNTIIPFDDQIEEFLAQIPAAWQLALPIEDKNLASCQILLQKMHNRFPVVLSPADVAGYDRELDQIHMPAPSSFGSPEMYYFYLFHEIIHSTGHPSRLNRSELMDWKEQGDDNSIREELIAEHGAVYCCILARISDEIIPMSRRDIQCHLFSLEAGTSCLPNVRVKAQQALHYLLSPSSLLAS